MLNGLEVKLVMTDSKLIYICPVCVRLLHNTFMNGLLRCLGMVERVGRINRWIG